MKNGKKALQLLIQLRNSLQSDQGMKAKQFDQAIEKLDQAIAALEEDILKGNACNLKQIIAGTLKMLPSLIDLINRHWKA